MTWADTSVTVYIFIEVLLNRTGDKLAAINGPRAYTFLIEIYLFRSLLAFRSGFAYGILISLPTRLIAEPHYYMGNTFLIYLGNPLRY